MGQRKESRGEQTGLPFGSHRQGAVRHFFAALFIMYSFPTRYPTFIDALRDIDDALCMVFLFATLPSNNRLPPELVENCARLAAEWQLYVMHSQSLRKVFISIKGVYYQAEVMGETVTWLVPHTFTQNVGPLKSIW